MRGVSARRVCARPWTGSAHWDGEQPTCSPEFDLSISLSSGATADDDAYRRPLRRSRPRWASTRSRYTAMMLGRLLWNSRIIFAALSSGGCAGGATADSALLAFVAPARARILPRLRPAHNMFQELPTFSAVNRCHGQGWRRIITATTGHHSETRRNGQRLHRYSTSESSTRLRHGDEEGSKLPDSVPLATPTTTARTKSVALPASAPACGARPHLSATARTTRLGFLRQSSAAALIVSAAAASSGLLLPEHRMAASATAADNTALAGRARGAVSSGRTAGGLPGDDMVWLDEDSGTVVTTLTQVDEAYCAGFVAYLARFLLNYDEACKVYFTRKVEVAAKRADGSEIWEEFRGFVASVGFGLHRYQGAEGPRMLCESLARKYSSGNRNDGSAGQLATLFSLLPPERQPVSAIKSLVAAATASAARSNVGAGDADANSASAVFSRVSASMASVGFDLPSILEESPSSLLPSELLPQFDKVSKTFFVPGARGKQGEMQLAFGTRGPFPISKERALTVADFGLFAACGAFGCTTTHFTVIPLDVVKTRLQTEPGKYAGLAEGVTTIAREEGWRMLMQGMEPTLAGYFWYGITVYPGYELFKRLYIGLLGPLNAALFHVPLVLAAGATATCFACIGVCPAEAVRIRQVADPAVGDMPTAIKQIVSESGWGKLYEGLPSILFRQISFGMMKFLVFDFFTEFAYGVLPMLAEQTSTQLGVSLISGLVAGVCAAIVSQPADTVLSRMNKDPGRASIAETLRAIVDERGLDGLFLGLQSRIVWSGAIISGQFLLYDVCKTALHVGSDDLKVFLDVIASVEL